MTHKSPTIGSILTSMQEAGKILWKTISERQRVVLSAIMACHTVICGFTRQTCPECGHVHTHYGSCNNSCCPSCGFKRREKWVQKQRLKAVNAPVWHIIFTVPDSALNRLFLHDKAYMYSSLFKAVSKTLKDFAADKKFFGVKDAGFVCSHHSWGSTLNYHNHIHVMFNGAGLDSDGNLVVKSGKFLFPAKALAAAFKGNFLELICKKFEYSNSPWLDDINQAKRGKWNVEVIYCGGDVDRIIRYMGRYINRVGISNARIHSHKNGYVTFWYKDNKKKGKKRLMKLKEEEFLRRFLMHIPPKYYVRCRSYGYLSNNCGEKLMKIQELTHTVISEDALAPYGNPEDDYEDFTVDDTCPKCGTKMITFGLPRRTAKQKDYFKLVNSAPLPILQSG